MTSIPEPKMIEIKVRIWGTGIGIGISRTTAIVEERFLPQESVQPPTLVPSPTKYKPDLEEEDDEVPVKKSSSNNGKRKRKGVPTEEEDDYPSDDGICIPAPIYNTETGEGERPTISLRSLRKYHSNHGNIDSIQPNTSEDVDLSEFLVLNHEKDKKSSSSIECIKNFWKSVEDQNYFQPYSKKTHRMDDLALRDIDYDDQSRTHKENDLNSHEDKNLVEKCGQDFLYQRLIASFVFSPHQPLPLGISHNIDEGYIFCESKITEIKGNPCTSQPDKLSQLISAKETNSEYIKTTAIDNVDLNTDIIGYIDNTNENDISIKNGNVLFKDEIIDNDIGIKNDDVLNNKEERINPNINGSDNNHKSSNHNHNTDNNDLFNAILMPGKNSNNADDNIRNTKKIEMNSYVPSIKNEKSDVGNNDNNHRIDDNHNHKDYNGSENNNDNVNNINRVLTSSATTHPLSSSSAILANTDSNSINSNEINYDNYESNHYSYNNNDNNSNNPSNKNDMNLTHSQKALLELIELGLIHNFDKDVYIKDNIEDRLPYNDMFEIKPTHAPISTSMPMGSMSSSMPISSTIPMSSSMSSTMPMSSSMSSTMPMSSSMPISIKNPNDNECIENDWNEHEIGFNWNHLPLHLDNDKVDDDINLSLRYLFEDLRGVEIDLNQRMAKLRKHLSQPSIVQEADIKRKTNETNRSFIGRWYKLKKKIKNVTKTIRKSEQRKISKEKGKEDKEKEEREMIENEVEN